MPGSARERRISPFKCRVNPDNGRDIWVAILVDVCVCVFCISCEAFSMMQFSFTTIYSRLFTHSFVLPRYLSLSVSLCAFLFSCARNIFFATILPLKLNAIRLSAKTIKYMEYFNSWRFPPSFLSRIHIERTFMYTYVYNRLELCVDIVVHFLWAFVFTRWMYIFGKSFMRT